MKRTSFFLLFVCGALLGFIVFVNLPHYLTISQSQGMSLVILTLLLLTGSTYLYSARRFFKQRQNQLLKPDRSYSQLTQPNWLRQIRARRK